jgi:hypothetical protein
MAHSKKAIPSADRDVRPLGRDEYESWLVSLEPEIACALAARSTLRALPLGFSETKEADLSEFVLLNVLRCTALTLARALYPETWEALRVFGHLSAAASHELSIQLLEARSEYHKFGSRILSWECDLSATEEALRLSVHLATLVFEYSDRHAAYGATEAAADAIDAVERGHIFRTSKKEVYGAGSDGLEVGRRARDRIWSANLDDASFIIGGDSVSALMKRPLWRDSRMGWCEGHPKRSIFPTSTQWRVWKRLIDRIRKRRPVSKSELFAYCSIPESVWKKGAASTNDHIDETITSGTDLSPPLDAINEAIVNTIVHNLRTTERSRR